MLTDAVLIKKPVATLKSAVTRTLLVVEKVMLVMENVAVKKQWLVVRVWVV